MISNFFFFKQKTAYEMRISDWSSDVCSSDLTSAPSAQAPGQVFAPERPLHGRLIIRDAQATDMVHIQRIYAHHVLHGTATFEVTPPSLQIGRASCRERVCQYV